MCCGASAEIESPLFDVAYSEQASLEESTGPDEAYAGLPFVRQPTVIIRDFGGNFLNISGTVVTASIERDSTTKVHAAKVIMNSSNTVSRVLHFKTNTFQDQDVPKEFLFVANLFNGKSYDLNSTLYIWDAASFEMREIQQIPTQGAQNLEHFIEDDQHFLLIANTYQMATVQ